MCGIAAVISGSREDVVLMGQSIQHRGKLHSLTEIDNIKVWFNWLPITDNDAPMQPFTSGKYTLWLNGYISNYKDLSIKYNIPLSTNCDTELLVKFIDQTGFNNLHELNGFFSVLVYDGFKVRAFTDRYGIKQLYKYKFENKTYIASEVKALLKIIPNIDLCPGGVNDWHYSLGVMTDNTIYKGITRVECLPFYKKTDIKIGYENAKKQLKKLFEQSIKRNKVEGINDGVFLSGGVDSGIIAKHINPDYSFSMDYQDGNFSETGNIKLNSTGIHYSMICNEDLFNKYKCKALKALDDLKAGSCYTNFAITELASKHCTVLYSGTGGDEVFDGYTHRYNKPINEVIKRSDLPGKQYNISHKEYDWRFLKAVLVIEDRMSGFHTMETRYPLLDNDFVDFALSLPENYRKNKRILKDISGLPKQVVNGRKKGFSNPYVSNYEWSKFALNEISGTLHSL